MLQAPMSMLCKKGLWQSRIYATTSQSRGGAVGGNCRMTGRQGGASLAGCPVSATKALLIKGPGFVPL